MSLLAISTALSAQKPVELELWPDGSPNSNGITTPEQKLENNRISNVSEPTLTRLVQRTRHHIRRIEIPYAKRTP